jgi:hypothetical protein
MMMPTNRTRRAQPRRVDETSERTRAHLLEGHDLVILDPDARALDDDELAEAWGHLRDELMSEHVAAHPGTRPYGWWAFDAPEPRRQLTAGPEPLPERGMYFGKPRCYRGVPPEGMYESETTYLARLGLLTEQERETLNR